MSDVEVLAKVLIERFGHVTLRPDFGWACVALNVTIMNTERHKTYG
jgi:hypothetical protein